MPFTRRFSRRRLGLAVAFFAAALVAGALIAARGTKSAERAQYERIEEGMDREQVREVLRDWSLDSTFSDPPWSGESWRAPNGATINVKFDPDGRVAFKGFAEGDVSLSGRAKRLMERVYP
jgi:hypothetical protein